MGGSAFFLDIKYGFPIVWRCYLTFFIMGFLDFLRGNEEKFFYDVELTARGKHLIAVVKVIKEVAGLSLREANDIIENTPKNVLVGVPKEEARAAKAKLEEVGATVTLK